MPLAHQRIRPFLWFQSQASEAVDFYLSVFPNSQRNDAFTPGESKAPLVIPFELDGQPMLAFNGGPPHVFNEAISLVVHCADQAEIDLYWSRLTEGGKEIACGWCKDKYGLCWQVIPDNIAQLLSHPNAMKAMMHMTKLNIAELERAAQQS